MITAPSFAEDPEVQTSILSPQPQLTDSDRAKPPLAPTTTPAEMSSSDDFQNPLDNNTPMPSYEGAIIKMLLTLFGLVAMVVITVWFLKKLSQGKIGAFGKKQISILERRPLSPKTVLYVVEVSGKQVLIAESHLEVKALTTIEAHADA